MATTQPNVVLFITHDTGRFISPYGVKTVHTPNCERLAAEGVLVSQCFCTTPLCSPSRAACVTGRYPHQNGVNGLPGPLTGQFDLYRAERHAARLFADSGYESVLCGFEHETPHWKEVGFHRSLSGPGGHYNGGGDLRNHAREIDGFLAERDAARPFYMQIGCHETHHAWTQFDTPPDDSLGLMIPEYLKDIPEVQREVAEFQGAVRRLDDCLGEILDTLERRGVLDNTIFVFTTDHGIDFPRAKGTCYDAGIGVFLQMRFPGWGRGRRLEPLISNIDILPTLLEACSIPVPENIAGRSFLPLLQGRPYHVSEAVFAEKTYHDTYDPTRAVRTERYKYIRYFEVCIFQDLRLATETRRHYFKNSWRRTTVEELYDLETDPGETNNVAADPANAEVLKELRGRLLAWMKKTDDPLLRGPVASPYYQRQMEELQKGV